MRFTIKPSGGQAVFDPNRNITRINREMVYLNACLFADIRLDEEKQVTHTTVRSSLRPRRAA